MWFPRPDTIRPNPEGRLQRYSRFCFLAARIPDRRVCSGVPRYSTLDWNRIVSLAAFVRRRLKNTVYFFGIPTPPARSSKSRDTAEPMTFALGHARVSVSTSRVPRALEHDRRRRRESRKSDGARCRTKRKPRGSSDLHGAHPTRDGNRVGHRH